MRGGRPCDSVSSVWRRILGGNNGGGYLAATMEEDTWRHQTAYTLYDSVHPVRQAARARSQKSAHRSLLPV